MREMGGSVVGDGWLSEGDGWLSEGDGWLSEGDGQKKYTKKKSL